MGFGDPYHKHPLRVIYNPPSTICFHCELPIASRHGPGCKDCDYYVHKKCLDLPISFRHPLHDQHLLTRFEPPPDSVPNLLCNECHNPCIGRFAYQCNICQFFFHLKCLFTLKLEKHQHPLIFDLPRTDDLYCQICGSDICGFVFGCQICEFYIHQECSLLSLEIKHHHVHKLTLRHSFPEECDQVYCDRCEDRDGEVDRTQSYYYCKDCDYIAHVNCCIAQSREDVFFLCERFTHEHLLRPNKTEYLLSCTQCSYTVSTHTRYISVVKHREYPSVVKHPCHPHHTLLFDSEPPDDGNCYFNCTECSFSMDEKEFVKFTHPLWDDSLKFICENSLFRCDACGELGKGSRIMDKLNWGRFDLHLECFSLPGKLEHESHPNHPLYLRWLDESTSRCCSVCTKEMDPQLWFYFCQECNYAAHMDCVARNLLSTLRSSIKNQSDFCAIIKPEESSFEYHIADKKPRPFVQNAPSYSMTFPTLQVKSYNEDDDSDYYEDEDDEEDGKDEDDDDDGNCDLGIDTIAYGLACPKCNSFIPTQAGYSTIKCWKSSFRKNSIMFANDQTPSESEPLSFLDEQMIDEICCSICNLLIFPPTISCASCQIFFHKSCAELPQKILYNDTTYVLMAPPFPEGLSDCTECKSPISSWAYISPMAGLIFDVHCAAGAPLVNPNYCKHELILCYNERYDYPCSSCDNEIKIGSYMMKCRPCNFHLHLECGLLPAVIKHRIHQHPLELATDLCEKDCEYICDVCEKDLNPDLWAYRCVDTCGKYATSHVSCVITSKKKCHFSYDLECETWTEKRKQRFRREARKVKGEEVSDSTSSSSE